MDGRDALIEELRATVARLEAKLEQQAARIVELDWNWPRPGRIRQLPPSLHPVISQSRKVRKKSLVGEKSPDAADNPDMSSTFTNRCHPTASMKPSNMRSMTTRYKDSDADRRLRSHPAHRTAGSSGPRHGTPACRLSGRRRQPLHPRLSRIERADLRSPSASNDRLAQVGQAL